MDIIKLLTLKNILNDLDSDNTHAACVVNEYDYYEDRIVNIFSNKDLQSHDGGLNFKTKNFEFVSSHNILSVLKDTKIVHVIHLTSQDIFDIEENQEKRKNSH